MSKQLPDNSLKHSVSDEVHELHLSPLTMGQEAGVELLREDGAHFGEVGGNQATLDGVMDGTVVFVK